MKQILLAIVLLLQRSEQVIRNCEPVEEGASLTLSCIRSRAVSLPVTPNPVLIIWSTRSGGSTNQLISTCDQTLSCTGNNEYFTISIAQRQATASSYQYTSNITINSVSLTTPFNNERTWTCGSSDGADSCNLQIYVKPVNPQCQATEVLNDDGVLSRINLTCTADRVYPEEKCVFERIRPGDGSRVIVSQESPCQASVGMDDLSAGENRFEARVGSSRQNNFNKIQPIPVTPAIQLRLPRTGFTCPGYELKDGYYRGEIVRCTCKTEDSGKPRGNPALFVNDRIHIYSTRNDEIRRFPISYASNGPEQNYSCAGISTIGQETPRKYIFSEMFAFYQNGRTTLSTSDEGAPVNICCGNPGVLVSCEKGRSRVNPAPRFALLVDDAPTSGFKNGFDDGRSYTQHFTFLPKFGGIYRVGCRIENAIFRDMKEDISTNMTIFSPVQFTEASNVQYTFETETAPGTQVVITFEINAYPNNISSTLYRGDLEQNNTVQFLAINYMAVSLSNQTVELIMEIDSSLDLTTYSLMMYNGIGNELVYTFSLKEATSDDGLPLLPLIAGICAGVVVITALVIAVIYWRHRRAKATDAEPDEAVSEGIDNEAADMESEDERTVYNNIPGEEEEEETVYDEYVDSVDSPPPSVAAPRPPNTVQHPMPSAEKAKEKVQAKEEKVQAKREKALEKAQAKKEKAEIKALAKEEKTKTPKAMPNPKPPRPKPERTKTKDQKGDGKSSNQEKVESSSDSQLPGPSNTGSERPGAKRGRADIPPPRPPPRKAAVQDDYINISEVAAALQYDTADPTDEDREYHAIQKTNSPNSSRPGQNVDSVEEEAYYSSINEEGSKPVKVMF